jgi:hypothetical protein
MGNRRLLVNLWPSSAQVTSENDKLDHDQVTAQVTKYAEVALIKGYSA